MIRGAQVMLRPAMEQDRRSVFEWMANSDITPSMMGPPVYAEAPIPTWEEFCADYLLPFFDGSRPWIGRSYIIEAGGEAVGHISYSQVDSDCRRAELDIWLRSEEVCGRGYGPDALAALASHLHRSLGLVEFVVRPSRRNRRAIKAYMKAGFTPTALTTDQQSEIYGATEHFDTIVLSMSLSSTASTMGSAVRMATNRIWFMSSSVTFRVSHADSEDGVSIIEHCVPHGDSPPLHFHRTEDEIFHILEGEFRMSVSGQERRAGPGETVLVPKGVAHSYRVESPEGGRFLTITARGDFERFVRAFGRPAEHSGLPERAPAPSPDAIAGLTQAAAQYGIEVIGPPLA